MKRPVVFGIFFGVSFIVIFLFDVVLPESLAIILLDRGGTTYPYSVQNLMWIVFFVGLGELVYRYLDARREHQELSAQYLPEDERTILQKASLPGIYKKANLSTSADDRFLPETIKRIITVFQMTNSIENAGAALNSSVELRSADLDLRYSMIRYIMWFIPTLGFIGTVIGIALALAYAGEPGKAQDPELLTELTRRLAVAFNTTLVALVMSSLLVFIMHVVQSFEERTIHRCGRYCLDNLVNRLYNTSVSKA